MINKIKIKNFQSHKDTTIPLDKGINAIVGQSDNGKTSIIRALLWARYNQPAGDAYVAKWARNEKGKQTKQTSVTIEKGGSTLVKGKGGDLTGYDIEGKLFTALGKGGVPEQVDDFFNMSSVNIQSQMDTPFLIGDTPTEKAKFLNSIVDMSEIDLYLSKAEGKKRGNSKKIKNLTSEVEGLKEQLTVYTPLEEVKKLVGRVEKIQARTEAKRGQITALADSITNYTTLRESLKKGVKIAKLEKVLTSLEGVSKEAREKREEGVTLTTSIEKRGELQEVIEKGESLEVLESLLVNISNVHNKLQVHKQKEQKPLEQSIKQYKEQTQALKGINKVGLIEGLIDYITNIKEQLKGKGESYATLKKSVRQYKDNTDAVGRLEKRLTSLIRQLPDTCPTCNQLLDKELII